MVPATVTCPEIEGGPCARKLTEPSAIPEGRVSNAPSGTSETRYCLRVAALTGSNVETIQCWTRSEWADQDVDVDQAWARDGVSVVG